MPHVTVNGVELYHEVRGAGPSLLLVMGATGDGGVFDAFADALADEFTVITFDRRGNGRSPRPARWDTTSPEEQADDAAALLDALGLAPAAIFATSSAGIFALTLAIRHPGSVHGAVLHEPALFAWFDDPAEARERISAIVGEAMRSGGPAAAFERFLGQVAGDATWERVDPVVRARMLSSAGTYFEVESGRFDTYLPDDDALATLTAPIRVLVSDETWPEFRQAAGRLAARIGVPIARTPGTHFAYVDHPIELAHVVKPLVWEVSGTRK